MLSEKLLKIITIYIDFKLIITLALVDLVPIIYQQPLQQKKIMGKSLKKSNKQNNIIKFYLKSFVNAYKSLPVLLILTLLIILNLIQQTNSQNNIKILDCKLYLSNLLCNCYISFQKKYFYIYILSINLINSNCNQFCNKYINIQINYYFINIFLNYKICIISYINLFITDFNIYTRTNLGLYTNNNSFY